MKDGTMYNLEVRFAREKSFYGKAKIKVDKWEMQLYSYDTHIATFDMRDQSGYIVDVYQWNSKTSIRHINEFFQQQGFCKKSKNDYTPNVKFYKEV